ncbi:hypothetical protein CWO89_32875, partial [Bradyrhizobium sp. Leo170]
KRAQATARTPEERAAFGQQIAELTSRIARLDSSLELIEGRAKPAWWDDAQRDFKPTERPGWGDPTKPTPVVDVTERGEAEAPSWIADILKNFKPPPKEVTEPPSTEGFDAILRSLAERDREIRLKSPETKGPDTASTIDLAAKAAEASAGKLASSIGQAQLLPSQFDSVFATGATTIKAAGGEAGTSAVGAMQGGASGVGSAIASAFVAGASGLKIGIDLSGLPKTGGADTGGQKASNPGSG